METTFASKRIITKMNRNLKSLKGEEKSAFISQAVLNLALYGGKDAIDGLEEVEAALCEVRDILYNNIKQRGVA